MGVLCFENLAILSAAFLRRDIAAESRTLVDLARAIDLSLWIFGEFLPIGQPTWHAADGEQDGEDEGREGEDVAAQHDEQRHRDRVLHEVRQ